MAKKYSKKPIEVAGISTVTVKDSTFCELPMIADKRMFEEAYAMAGITNPFRELEYMGIHDCPASMVIPVSEAAGYIKPGEAWKIMRDGRMNFDQDRPISTSGGRTQSGHPRAPAFLVEIAEAVSQMRGENGARQMAKPPKCSAVWGGGAGYSLGACVLRTL
jgi:acetyl-CoA C-acetyltransferase